MYKFLWDETFTDSKPCAKTLKLVKFTSSACAITKMVTTAAPLLFSLMASSKEKVYINKRLKRVGLKGDP